MTDLKTNSAPRLIGANKKAYPLHIKFATIERFLLLLVLYTSPMHKVAWDVGIRIRIEYICVGFLLILGASRFLRGRFRVSNFTVSIAGALIWIAFSIFTPIFNVVNYPLYLKGLLSSLISLYVALYLLQHIKDSEIASSFWDHWWKAGLIMVIYGLAQWGLWAFLRINLDEMLLSRIVLNLRKTGLNAYMADVSRVTSLALDTNNFSLYLSTLLPLGLYKITSAPTRRKRLTALIFGGLILVVDILTLSRSGLGGFIIATVLIFPLLWLTGLRLRRFRYGLVTLTVSIIFLGIVLLLLFSPAYWMQVIQMRLRLSSGTSLHFQLLADSFDLFLRSPIVGWGANQFGPLYTLYYRPDLLPVWNTHNGFATIGVETGLLGLLGHGILFIYTISLTMKAWTKVTPRRVLLFFLLWGYIAYLVGNMGYNSFGFSNFWVYQSLLIASAGVWLKEWADNDRVTNQA